MANEIKSIAPKGCPKCNGIAQCKKVEDAFFTGCPVCNIYHRKDYKTEIASIKEWNRTATKDKILKSFKKLGIAPAPHRPNKAKLKKARKDARKVVKLAKRAEEKNKVEVVPSAEVAV